MALNQNHRQTEVLPINKLLAVENYRGKFQVNEAYRPIAVSLCKKFPELKHVPTGSILFLDLTEAKGVTNNKIINAQISKMPEKWHEIIYQLTGRRFQYYMEFFQRNIGHMSKEQIILLIYHELRHVGMDGSLVHHDIEEWANMYHRLGVDWSATKRKLPDLLDTEVDWDSIKQTNLFTFPIK